MTPLSSVSAQVVIMGSTATGSGNLTAGFGTLTDPIDTLIIENATTVVGGRTVLLTNTTGDVTVDADFSALGLVSDPTGFARDDRLGFHIQATNGSVNANLDGNATIQAGTDENLSIVTLLHDHVGGIVIESLDDVSLNYNGDLVVTHADLTADSNFVTGVDHEGFAAMRVESSAPESAPGDVTFTHIGNLTLNGNNQTATATDAVGSNRTIVGATTSNQSQAFYGIFALGGGDLNLTNTGDITVNGGDRSTTVSSIDGRAETVMEAGGAAGIALTRSATGDGFLINRFDEEFDNATVNQTGDVNVTVGDVSMNVTSSTPLVGDPSEAYGELSAFSNQAWGVQLENGLNLDADIVGDINIDGGTVNATIDALSGPDTTRGLVAADISGTDVTGFTARSPLDPDIDDSTGDITLDGNITANGADVNVVISGSGLAPSRSTGFPPDPGNPLGSIRLNGGDALAGTVSQFDDREPGLSRGDIDLSLNGAYLANGGNVVATLNGSNLPATTTGGRATGFSTSFDAVRLTTGAGTQFGATGGTVDLTLNGTHGDQIVNGGAASGARFRLQSNTDVTFARDATATGGAAAVTGTLNTDSTVFGGEATGLAIGTSSTYFFGEDLTPAQQAELDARETFITGSIVATGGDATTTDPDALTIGGTATGVLRESGTTLVIQGDVTATGGTGDSFDGVVFGVRDRGTFFPGAVPLDEPSQTIRIEGTVTARGEGVDASVTDLRGSDDLLTSETAAAGVNISSFANQQLVIANGGSVVTDGDFVHGAVMGSEANTVVIESGGSINAQGANASGIEVRPYQDLFFFNGGTAQDTTATITVEQGGSVTSQLGTGIRDDDRGQTVVFAAPITRTVDTYENQTNVIVGGTVTGGNGTAISLESGVDRVELLATSQVNGNILLGDGNDRFAFEDGFTITGTVDGGSGDDIVEADIASELTRVLDVASLPLNSFEVVEKTGQGSLTLISTPSVGASVLRVNEGFADTGADLTNLSVEVNSGGTFFNDNLINDVTTAGTGRFIGTHVGGNLVNNGVTSPGGDDVAGTIDVAGDLTLGAGGTLAMDIFADGSSDMLSVDGTLTLGGTLAVNGVMFPMGFADDAEYAALTSPGAIIGMFDSVTDNLPDVDAMVTILPPTGPLDPLDPNRPGTVVISYVRSDSTSNKSIHANSIQFAGQAGLLFGDTLQRQARLLNRCYHDGKSFWQTGLGSYTEVDSTGSTTGYSGGTGGYAAGADRQFALTDACFRIGMAGAYTGSSVDSGYSNAEIDGNYIGVYGSLRKQAWLMSSSLAYGFLDYDLNRAIPLSGGGSPMMASGSSGGGVFTYSWAGSYDLAQDIMFADDTNFRFAPIARFDYFNAYRGDYHESGAALLNLSAAGDRYRTGIVSLGIETGRQMRTSRGWNVNTLFDVRWEHLTGNLNTTSTSVLTNVGGAPFFSSGGLEVRNRVALGIGVGVDLSQRISTHLRYDASVANRYSSHRGSAGVTVRY